MSIGIPIKLIHEAEGHIVTLETTTGEIYRGKLLEAEDNMNCQLQNVTVTQRNGQVSECSVGGSFLLRMCTWLMTHSTPRISTTVVSKLFDMTKAYKGEVRGVKDTVCSECIEVA